MSPLERLSAASELMPDIAPVPLPPSIHTEKFRQRFFKYVDKSGSCWNWIGSKRSTGYGHIFVEGRYVGAHRIAYALEHGSVPPDRLVLHHCDNPSCVRPGHLFLGNKSTNAIDMYAKGQIHSNSS